MDISNGMKYKKLMIILALAIVLGAAYWVYSKWNANNPESSPYLAVLSRPVVVSAELPREIQDKVVSQLQEYQAVLLNDKTQFDYWIQLGIHFKFINDYEGARQAWEYASLIRPENSLSFQNLAELYGYYLQDKKAAVKNYARALANTSGPGSWAVYRGAADFYRVVMEDEDRAIELLEQGIVEDPANSENLKNLLQEWSSN